VASENPLFQAILARRSTRRYDRTPLEPPTLAQVEQIIAGVQPLVPQNRFAAPLCAVQGEALATLLGAYGRLVSPSHVLAPHAIGAAHVLTDLGYRSEQIAVRLTGLGIGSCYIGALSREDAARASAGLPAEARIAAFLIFGRPATAWGDRAINSLLHRPSGGDRMPVERIFFVGDFGHPAAPPPALAPLIQAGQRAPSAVNAQPWRFLWRAPLLYLCVTRHNPRYVLPANQPYALHDGGICMANIALALEALEMAGQWTLLEGTEPDLPEWPSNLHPLAVLALSGV